MSQKAEEWRERELLVGILLASLGAWALNTLLFGASEALVKGVWAGLAGIYVLYLLYVMRRRKTLLCKAAVPLLLGAGFLMQLLFVLRMPYNFSWHDLGAFGSLTDEQVYPGHLGLINYIVKFARLPAENPMMIDYKDFYHPPLYHLLQAGFFRVNLVLGIDPKVALENMQILTLCITSLCVWTGYRILRQLKISPRGIQMGLLFLVVQPSLFIFAGTLNNDIASVFFILLTVLYTLRWIEAPSLRRIIGIALSLGLGMAVKLSIAVIAVPIGLVFAIRFFQNIQQWKNYLRQFLIFLLISVPLGTAWPIFHAVAFQMPLNHVPLPAETINVGHLPLAMRFGAPSGEALHSLFYSAIRRVDYNVWFQTLKTALFDELTLFSNGSRMWYVSYGTAALFTVLAGVSVLLFIRWLLRRNTSFAPLSRLFLGVYGIALLGSYFLFCLQYPYICTFNFRYILPSLVLCAIALGDFCQQKNLPAKLLGGLIIAFGSMSCLVYSVYLLG